MILCACHECLDGILKVPMTVKDLVPLEVEVEGGFRLFLSYDLVGRNFFCYILGCTVHSRISALKQSAIMVIVSKQDIPAGGLPESELWTSMNPLAEPPLG